MRIATTGYTEVNYYKHRARRVDNPDCRFFGWKDESQGRTSSIILHLQSRTPESYSHFGGKSVVSRRIKENAHEITRASGPTPVTITILLPHKYLKNNLLLKKVIYKEFPTELYSCIDRRSSIITLFLIHLQNYVPYYCHLFILVNCIKIKEFVLKCLK